MKEYILNAKSAFNSGANIPIDVNLGSLIKIWFDLTAHLIEYGGFDLLVLL